ncbi:nuclease-related domain-containing protein [Arthrobacter sp. NPDC058288]|uniref:nuclease-related domain-containing protein n=1 Tax=Arthrobacter sp. NPDC058288 TaxID=3346424 RepID=UPI0036ED62E2
MAAGDGASEQSRLAAERIARLKRQLDHAERAADTWGAGAEGERRTATLLGRLTPDGWFMLHDVHWPGRPLANLDHVLVGPGGVVVVDAKNWSGTVEVRDGILRQNGYSRNPAVDGALGQAAAVAALLGAPHRRLVRSIICLTGHPDFAEVTESGIEVLGINRVVARIAALPAVLDVQTVVGLYSHLGQQLTQPQAPAAKAPAVPDFRGNPARNPLARPYQGGVYPAPVPARSGYRSAGRPPQPGDQASTGKLVAVLWSLLVLGIVAFSLSAPLWNR